MDTDCWHRAGVGTALCRSSLGKNQKPGQCGTSCGGGVRPSDPCAAVYLHLLHPILYMARWYRFRLDTSFSLHRNRFKWYGHCQLSHRREQERLIRLL